MIRSEENNNNLSDGASPGFRSSSGDEDSTKAAMKRKKLKKKKERDNRKRESETDTIINSERDDQPRRIKDQNRDGGKSSSPDKSLSSIKQRQQTKDSPDRKPSLSEERKPPLPRKASTFTNYDLADALRKISILLYFSILEPFQGSKKLLFLMKFNSIMKSFKSVKRELLKTLIWKQYEVM